MVLSTEIRCRIDKQLKEDAQRVLGDLGLSISQAIRIFLRQVVAAGGLPFEMKRGTASQVRETRARYRVKQKRRRKPAGKAR